MDSDSATIRRAAVAGAFYPGNPGELTTTIAGLFSQAKRIPVDGRPIGLVAPHAGYPYSGQTAARAYKQIEGEQYDTVVVISPSHTVFFKGSSVFGGQGYETPLGLIKTDREIAGRIAEINAKQVYFSNQGHASGASRGEHALEVQLPFLQVMLGEFKLVPIVMGDQEEDSVRALGEALASGLRGTNSLIVASSDLSHFHSAKAARRLDDSVKEAVQKFDPDLLVETIETGQGEACGAGPIAAMMIAARRLGATVSHFIDYSHSGETTGDFNEVVGYLSAAITVPKDSKPGRRLIGARSATAEKKKKIEKLSDEDRRLLLKIARDAIEARIKGQEYIPPEPESLSEHKGAFVTLNIHGKLRGCIGRLRSDQPLYKTVAEMAVAAAFEDPRFPELTESEVEALDIEISVLSPLHRVHDLDEIQVGRDGLMVKLDWHSGLLLPQVATTNGWGPIEFLEQTCLKAGLPKNSYQDRNAEIYRFSAEVF